MLPFIADETVFALKGGTAINLFVRDLPRLSVDIDLTYLPVEPRSISLKTIDEAMARLSERIRLGLPGTRITEQRPPELKIITKLFVKMNETQIKIEVTPVL